MRTALLVLVASCAGGAKPGPVAPKEEAVDPAVAAKGAKDLVQELYEDVGHGNTDSLQALLDPKLMVLGPRKGDAVANRADAILAVGRYADAKKKLHPNLKSSALGVNPSDGGHSAWGFDQLNANGEQWAVLVVMSGSNDLWSLDAVSLGETPPMAKVKAELKQDAIVPPAAGVTVKSDPAIAAIVEKFQKGLADQETWAADLRANDKAIVVGPTAGEVARGKKDIKALWKKRLKAHARAMLAGEISGAATRDGMLVWVSAPITRAEDGEELLPLRAFAVYAKTGASWSMIALQESLAIDAPGSGVPFKKFVPPSAAPPPEENKPEKVAEKKVKKKKPAADDGDETPKKVVKKKKKPVEADPPPPADDPPPKKKKKKPVDDDDAAATDDAPKKKHRGFGGGGDDRGDESDAPKKTMKKKAVDDETDDAPKKKKKKPDDDDVKVDD